jgi:hypothetical protein
LADLEIIPVTIASGTALSPSIGIGIKTLVGISMPSGWTTAALTFQISPDGVIFQEYVDATGAAAITVATPAANTFIAISSGQFDGVNQLKVRSGTVGTPVNQGADRVIGLVVRTVAF